MDEANGTSQRIYHCALRILEAEGPQAVSMRRVAKEVGITAMAIYHHFPEGKTQLVAEAASRKAQDVRQSLRGSIAHYSKSKP